VSAATEDRLEQLLRDFQRANSAGRPAEAEAVWRAYEELRLAMLRLEVDRDRELVRGEEERRAPIVFDFGSTF
jgi:hypothetical protein